MRIRTKETGCRAKAVVLTNEQYARNRPMGSAVEDLNQEEGDEEKE